jgi:hypothetical protein
MAEPVRDVSGLDVNTGQVPSPPTSSPAMEHVGRPPSPLALSLEIGASTRAEQEPIPPVSPMEMALGTSHRHQERATRQATGPAVDATEVEDIP